MTSVSSKIGGLTASLLLAAAMVAVLATRGAASEATTPQLPSLPQVLELEAGWASDYVARTGFHTGHGSFQGHVLYSAPLGRHGATWWVGAYGYAGGGIYSEEFDLLAGVAYPTSQRSWAQLIVSYDELEPTIQLGIDDGDLLEIVPGHYWRLSDQTTLGVAVDWLQPVTWFHGAAVPYLQLTHQRPVSSRLKVMTDFKIGYDGGGYGGDVGIISLLEVEGSYALNRSGTLTLQPKVGLFVPISGSINDRDVYLYGGAAINQAITW